jgi:hypothetical protein
MEKMKLYMCLLGCTPEGRHTEQHDIFFGVATELKELEPDIINFWPEAKGKIHIDAWREVQQVDGYDITVKDKEDIQSNTSTERLFFINLGGYKENEFDEFHYKFLAVAADKGVAVQQAKQTAFYKHMGFEKASSHIDDKYGVDVDDIYAIEDILTEECKQQFSLQITKATSIHEDALQMGYFKLDKL